MRRELHTVTTIVSVPAGENPAEVVNLAISAAVARCEGHDWVKGDIKGVLTRRLLACSFGEPASTFKGLAGTTIECEVDPGEAHYIGCDTAGVYYQSFQDPNDKSWWLSVYADDSDGVCIEHLVRADGPYDNEAQADESGFDLAVEWCENEGVDWEERA